MIDLLKYIRLFVFLMFVVSNAVTTSVAVWNLSIIESNILYVTVGRIDTYLIILGSIGLLLIFPIIFLEIYGKTTTLGKVWFELLWVGLFGIMELVGASFITSQSTFSMCAERQIDSQAQTSQTSPCTSTQVLIAFTWIPALLLLGYETLLLILAFVKSNEDRSVWTSGVGTYPWIRGIHNLKSAPTSPQKPMFRSKTPVIYAPRPRRAGAPVLAYRSGIDSEYDIERFQPSPPPGSLSTNMNIMSVERPMPPIPATTANSTFQIKPLKHQPQAQPVFSTPFYHSSVQRVIEERPGPSSAAPQAPPAAQLGEVRRLAASPPPLGDWPRLDATSRPRMKKKPLPTPLTIPAPAPASASIVQPSRSQTSFAPEPEPQPLIHALPPPPQRQPRRHNLVPPPPPPPQSVVSPPVSSELPSMTASIAPLPPRRARPSGPRRASTDNQDDPPSSARRTVPVPPHLDLSKISSYKTHPSPFR